MPELNPMIKNKPSFVSSVLSGVGGYIKGAIAAGIAGGVGGAIVGAALGGLALATGGASTIGLALAAVASSTVSGAVMGAAILAPLGALAGLITGVVRSREPEQASAKDIINVAKISFAQGVQVGAKMEKMHSAGKFEQAYVEEKNKPMIMAERQVSH